MNLITAIIIVFLVLLVLLAIYVLYHWRTSNDIDDMKRIIWIDIKTLYLEDVFNFLAIWIVCSAALFAVVNFCGLLINIFIAADINFFELVLDGMLYDPLAQPIKLTNLTASS